MCRQSSLLLSVTIALVLLCACSPIQAPLPAAAPPATPLPTALPTVAPVLIDPETTAAIDATVEQQMARYGIPGFELCILKEGQVAYSKGFGLADVAAGRAVSDRSLLLQASLTKPLVATAVLQLAEQGKIDLDAPLTAYLPEFSMADERYRDITVRMALSQRAGLPNTPDFWADPLDPSQNPLDQALLDLKELDLLADPGSEWFYSNYGFTALGAIISRVTGQPFELYMQQSWLDPLGMTSSTFAPAELDPATMMTLYETGADRNPLPANPGCDARDATTCNLVTSCSDLVKWVQMVLNRGELDGTRYLAPSAFEEMWAPVSTTGMGAMGPLFGPPFAQYGMGWFVGESQGHRLAGHLGGGLGVNTQLQLAPDDDLAVIAMSNWADPEEMQGPPASEVAFEVLNLLLGIQP